MTGLINKTIALEVEHYYKNKFISRHTLRPHQKTTVLGSAQAARVRLLGSDVQPIHAYVEYQDGEWFIVDAGSEKGTWFNKKPILREQILTSSTFEIGQHQLKFIRHEVDTSLFKLEDLKKDPEMAKTAQEWAHQIVVKHKGVIYKTHLAPATQFFTFQTKEKSYQFSPPQTKDEILESTYDDYSFVQRLVPLQKEHQTLKGYWSAIHNSEVRRPFVLSAVFFVLTAAIFLAIPKKPQDALVTPELDQNRFTRMIVDADMMKQKRAEAQERQNQMQRLPSSGPGVASTDKKPQLTTPVQAQGATPKVVSQIKTQGLSQLLNKISNRATAVGVKIETHGVVADSQPGLGRALASAQVGQLQGVAQQAGNNGTVHRVGAVGTVGRGGGTGTVAGLGGLAVGAAGAGSVGILDEETEIVGGLDKDVIARVIAGYLGEIRYCYERQLSAEPDLYGKVVLRFSIEAGGEVTGQRVGLSTLKSAMVEGCILRRVAQWKFPKPKGGTTVLVSYPFLFKSTN